MKNLMAPRYTTRIMPKLTGRIADDFGLRSLVIQKPFSPKKGVPL